MATKPYYFYVLLCADGTFYGGFTDDVAARVATHNAGKGAKYTKRLRTNTKRCRRNGILNIRAAVVKNFFCRRIMSSGRACQSDEKSVYFIECGMHKPH